MRQLGLSLFFLFRIFTCEAQDSTLRYDVTLAVSGSTGRTPFWGYANQQGIVPDNGNFVLGQWQISKSYNIHDPRLLQWRAGAELITSYGNKENVFFTDLYAAVKLGPVELMAGQNKNLSGLTDTTLSSGSLSISGNARPIPRVQLALPEFYPLNFTGGYVSIKASYSDGVLRKTDLLLGDVRYRPLTYLHQKSLYFRLGRPDQRFAFYTGLNHQVIWGGEDHIWPTYELKKSDAYWHAITGIGIDNKKIGLHLGTLDLGAEWKGLNWSYLLYRQNIYETGSLYGISNFRDGLSGIRMTRNSALPNGSTYLAIHSLVVEVIGTKNQLNRSPAYGLSIYENANYYNSFLYRGGWSNRGLGMGSPLAAPQGLINKELPGNTSQFTSNNRFWAFHAAVSATWLGAKFTLKSTYSLNYGALLTPFDRTQQQVSVYLSAARKMPFFRGVDLTAAVSSDYGNLYPHTTALLAGIRKTGFLK